MLKRIFLLLAIVFIAGTYLSAQITSSSLSGAIADPSTGEALIGASVIATHLPSGTKYSTTSTKKGVFTINDMRVGGPYKVVVSFVGFESVTFDDVILKLAEPFLLDVSMKKKDGSLETVIISTTKRNPIFNSHRTGATTNVGVMEIAALPSISRSINDFTRITPQANGVSIGGGNFRQNNITIDGSDFNNSFGISTGGGGNLPAGGTPISIDALEEITVSITPFDIRQSGFIGSAINAVTRSGTNTFTGSLYHYFRDANQQGNKVNKTVFTKPPFEFKQYGGRFGGPIIKNKLFFFLSYEKDNEPSQVQKRFAATATAPFGSSPNIARPTVTDLNDISNYLKTTYNYVTGPYDNYVDEKTREKYLARLDWNINKNNRFNVRYSSVKGGDPVPPSTSVTGSNYPSYSSGAGRVDNNAMWFKNSNYFQGINFSSFAAELNSHIRKFSNVLRGTYTYQDEERTSTSSLFPFVDILSGGSPFTSFGYEPFTLGNIRKVKTYSFVDNLSWNSGKHSWTVGAQADFSKILNGFQRFAMDFYIFDSWNEFITTKRPIAFAQTFSFEPNFAQAFPSFKFGQYSAYGQDEIKVNNKLRLTFGLRLDMPSFGDVAEIKTNPFILAATFTDGKKFNTGTLPDKKLMWSPRFSFNYDVYGNRSLQFRGGTGVFTGKVPFVWLVSQSGDNGMLQTTVGIYPATTPNTYLPYTFNPVVGSYRPSTLPTRGSIIPSASDALTPNYKFPQTWKTSLALDTKLPANIVFSVEAIFNKDLNTPYFNNINLSTPSPLALAGYPDSRNIYPATTTLRFLNPILNDPATGSSTLVPSGTTTSAPKTVNSFNVIELTNGKKGSYASLTAQLKKQFSNGFFAYLSYTKSFANNLFDGGGDQPLSAWQSTATINGSNNAKLGYASYVVPDRLTAGFSFRKEYLKHFATTISLIYNGSIDGRFSYVYGADFNRDGVNGNDLIYIPKDASEITFVDVTGTSSTNGSTYNNGIAYSAKQQSDLFFAYIAQDKYLSKHMGQYAERNGAQFPWRNQVDIKILQDLFINVGKQKNTIQLSLDIVNVGNAIDANWGKFLTVNTPSILVPTNQNSLVPGGAVRPTFRLANDRNNPVTSTFRNNVSIASTYYMQMGLRYLFN